MSRGKSVFLTPEQLRQELIEVCGFDPAAFDEQPRVTDMEELAEEAGQELEDQLGFLLEAKP